MPSLTLREQIINHLKANKIPVVTVAAVLGISRDHLYKMLRGERPIIDSNLNKLNEYLNTNFQEPDKI